MTIPLEKFTLNSGGAALAHSKKTTAQKRPTAQAKSDIDISDI